MSERTVGYWRGVVRRRRWVLVLAGALVLVLLPGLSRLETDNSPEVFFVRGSDEWQRYQDFHEVFGNDETVRLVYEGEGLWSEDGLRFIDAVERSAAGLPGVVRVAGLPEHHRRFGWPPKDAADFRRRALANPLDRAAGWVGREGRLVTSLLQLRDLPPRETARLVTSLRELVAEAPAGVEARVLGLPVLNTELDRSSREIEKVFFPLLVLFTVILVAVVVRSPRQLLAPLLFVGLCQLATLAPMGYGGVALNMVLALLPPLIFVISLATALHLVLRVRHEAAHPAPGEDGSWLEVAVRVFRDKGWSIFWTGVTTMVGFASLMVSPVAPVRSLGAWAAIGLALTTVAAFTVLPALVTFLGDAGGGREARFERRVAVWGRTGARFAAHHRRGVMTALLAVSALCALGLPRLSIESNALRYLASEHPLRAGIEHLERRGVGVAALEVLITAPPPSGGAPPVFVSALEVDRLADLAGDVEQLEGVHGVVNAGVVLRDALRHVPSTPMNAHLRPQMALDGLAEDAQGREVLSALLAPDRLTARSTVFVSTAGATELEALEARIEEAVAVRFPEASTTVTGEYPLLLEAQRHLISTLISSLGLTFFVVALVLRLLLPSFRLTLLALVPNLWPVLGGLGLMGWAGVPLDIATVMMASVVLGLAVDDTIHTLGHFRRLAPVHGARLAVEHTLHATAPAYLLTGVILAAGFGVCGLSDFAPIARFGVLSSVSIGLAVVGDLVLLPALLSLTPDEVCRRLAPSPD